MGSFSDFANWMDEKVADVVSVSMNLNMTVQRIPENNEQGGREGGEEEEEKLGTPRIHTTWEGVQIL